MRNRKFESFSRANTDLNAHSRRNWDVTRFHKVSRYFYSNFTNQIDISGFLSRGFLFFFGERSLQVPRYLSVSVEMALNRALNEITFFPRKSGIGTREVDENKA